MEDIKINSVPELKNGGHYVPSKEMKKSEYLYGVQGSHFKNMIYADALTEKIKLAKEMVKEILKVHYTEVDSIRLNKVIDSINFNTAMLKELDGSI